MPQQNYQQNMTLPANGEVYPAESHHDETWYAMPHEGVVQQQDWNGSAVPVPYDASVNGMGSGNFMRPGVSGMQNNSAGMMPPSGMNGTTWSAGMSSQHAQSQRMKNPVDMASTHSPADNSEAYQASLRSLLSRNIGYYIVCTFLVGSQQHVTWEGILHTVGSDYLVLYQPDFERYVSCDLYALKFAQFHNTRTTPYCNGAQSMQGRLGW